MIKITDLYDLNETIASDYLKGFEYPWEALAGIKAYILELGKTLPEDRFEKRGEDIWVAKSAKVAPSACLNGPLIIDEDDEVRHCAFIRGSVIVGKNSVVGNSTELK
ncbi:MAG: UDP-N-acetylglucosamine pyrophosphorylase, partial [Lachnospiraceae bacterium]|nr:UDP-N-acetylglucosamine pyrophosphorylase [Lachnospiraceae bacterium]